MHHRPRLLPRARAVTRTLVALHGLILTPVALAQLPLANIASPHTFLAVALDSTVAPPSELLHDLAALDWRGASSTLASLAVAFDLVDDAEAWEGLLAPAHSESSVLAGLAEEICPGLAAALGARGRPRQVLPPLQVLLTIEPRPDGPAVTGLVRLPEATGAQSALLRLALRGCASGAEAVDGETLELLRFGPEMVLLVTEEGVLIASSDADAAVEAWRRSSGRMESSLADSESFAALARLEERAPSLAVLARPQALLDGLIGPSWLDDTEPLVERAAAAVETIDLMAATWTLGDGGLVGEWLVAVDPARPDPDLAHLLLCPGCTLARPYLAPSGAHAVTSGPLPLNLLTDWVSGWLVAAGEGDPVDRLRRETGVDLRRDALDWLGDVAHLVILEPHGTDLQTLLYQPGTIVLIPVLSQEAAAAGLARLEELLAAQLRSTGRTAPLALREGEYRGVPYRRVQASLNIDLGVALVGNHLVMALPAPALQPIVDTFLGGSTFVGEERYREAVAELPAGAHSLSLQDTASQLSALARIARLFAQPLAFAIDLALLEEQSPYRAPVDLTGVSLEPLPPGVHHGSLEGGTSDAEDQWLEGSLSDLFSLESVSVGDRVTVVVESEEFDTMLYLLDADRQLELDRNDDAPDIYRSELVFIAAPETSYVVQVTSFDGSETGAYRLTVEREPVGAEPDPPEFAQLLELAEFPARLLEVLATHFQTTVGYAASEENILFSRTVTAPTR